VKLSEWARQKNGLDCKTAHRLYRRRRFSRLLEQLPTGAILVHELPNKTSEAVLYALDSSSDQRGDLERQPERLRDFAAATAPHVVGEFMEVGSGLNGHYRKAVLKILGNPSFSEIVVERIDRLARFGADHVEAPKASNRELRKIKEQELNIDLVQDMVGVLISFCARLYAQRAVRNRAMRAMEAGRR